MNTTQQRTAFAVFADNGNIICFSTQRNHRSLRALEENGHNVVTLAEQSQPIAVAAMENGRYIITGIEDRCLRALRQRTGPRGTALIELYPGSPAGLMNWAQEVKA